MSHAESKSEAATDMSHAESKAEAPTPIGIDLGTTHSLVAVVEAGRARVLPGPEGVALIPSAVHYASDGRILVGARARAMSASAPERTFTSIKRLMGRAATDPEARRPMGYKVVDSDREQDTRAVRFDLGGTSVTPVEISAEILRELANVATRAVTALGPAVITVPAYFDDAQRQATRDAARLAGLELGRLLNEPTAALLAYGLETRKNGLFAVYDLGGGTFDVTILRLEDGIFQVKSTGGDSLLGGDDFDRSIVEQMLRQMGSAAESLEPGELFLLRDAARTLKHRLTDEPSAAQRVELARGRFEFALERAELDSIARPLLERTGRAARRALRDAELEPEQLDGVVLVGGMTRMVAVRDFVRELFRREPLAGIDPDTIVAEGAALRADCLARDASEVLLLDVLPLSLGIETLGGTVEKLLPRNSSVPTAARTIFTTHADDQTGFVLHVLQGERELARDCRSLGRFVLRGIPPLPAGQARLEVSFQVDESGLLTVTARELTSGLVQAVEVSPAVGLTTEEIEALLIEALRCRKQDLEASRLAELRVHGQSAVRATEKALAADGDLVTAEERAEIEASLQRLKRGLLEAERSLLLELLVDELHALTEGFSERRMHRAIVEAVTGQGLR
jgi:molecular chaperone HscA